MRKTSTKAAKQSQEPGQATRKKPATARSIVDTTFQLKVGTDCEVYVAGTFNDWDPRRDRLIPDEDGTMSTTLPVPRGTHEYKFVVNGVWCVDPECRERIPNHQGSLNGVLHVI